MPLKKGKFVREKVKDATTLTSLVKLVISLSVKSVTKKRIVRSA